MAIQLNKQIQVNIGAIVSESVAAVKTVRSQEQSRQESLFQQAVSDGLDYDSQLEFRKKQLSDLEKNSFVDPEYRNKLNDSIASTKKLIRFQKYRLTYSESLAELNAGTINAIEYSKNLKTILDQTDDVDLRSEIQGNITESELKVTNYKDTLLANQVKRAQYDGTDKVLEDAINKVKKARSFAAINDDDSAMEEYDLTISTLNSQKVQARAEDVVNDLALSGTMSTFNAKNKLGELSSQIDQASDDVPITIGGKKYGSEREYWEITRSAYLSGNGSGIFADYFGEVDAQYKDKISTELITFGQVRPEAIASMDNDFKKMKANPEYAPFITQIESQQALTIGTAVDKTAANIVELSKVNLNFAAADSAIKNLTRLYNVDTTGHQLSLSNVITQNIVADRQAGLDTSAYDTITPSSDFVIPSTELPAPAPAPAGAPATPAPAAGLTPEQQANEDEARRVRFGESATPAPATSPAPAPATAPSSTLTPEQRANEIEARKIRFGEQAAPAPTPTPQPTPQPTPAPVKTETPTAPAETGRKAVRSYTTTSGEKVTKYDDGSEERTNKVV